MITNGFGFEKRPRPPTSAEVASACEPFYACCIAAFGTRAMFESNFPPDRASFSYHTLWNAMKRVAGAVGLGEAEKDALFRGTAARVYGLRGAASQRL